MTTTTSAKKPNQGARLSQLEDALGTVLSAQERILELLAGQTQAQYQTPAPVADAVVEARPATKAARAKKATTPEPTPEPEPEKPASASDLLMAYVAEQGLAFARGGRVQIDADAAKAIVRVFRTKKPELLSLDGVGKLGSRSITHLAVGLADDGVSVITQYVYSPQES